MGMNLTTFNWIMGSIELASFFVLINGSLSSFFLSSRGLQQGCPLCPFLFLIVVEALSKLFENARRNGLQKEIKISLTKFLTHFIFVDDVLLFGAWSVQEFQALKETMDLFCVAT